MKRFITPQSDMKFTRASHYRSITDLEQNYGFDIDRICNACLTEGIYIDRLTAFEAWEQYSSTYAAGWLGMDTMSDSAIVNAVSDHCQTVTICGYDR